jgi:hypothetical protein
MHNRAQTTTVSVKYAMVNENEILSTSFEISSNLEVLRTTLHKSIN